MTGTNRSREGGAARSLAHRRLEGHLQYHLQSLAGIIAIIALAWVLSENRRAFPFRTVASGLALQFALALLLLKIPAARNVLFSLNGVVDALSQATRAGTSFVFGYV